MNRKELKEHARVEEITAVIYNHLKHYSALDISRSACGIIARKLVLEGYRTAKDSIGDDGHADD